MPSELAPSGPDRRPYGNDLDVTASFSGDSFTGTGSATGVQIVQNAASPPATANVTLSGISVNGFANGIDDEGGTVTFNAGNSVTNAVTGLLVNGAHIGLCQQHDQ